MMKNKIFSILFIAALSILSGCSKSDSPTDTTTTGYITISVDETFKPLINAERDTFHGIYHYAHVKVNYKTEAEAFSDLMNDSIRLIIAPRPFNKEELKQFEKWEIVPKSTKIAYDGVALIGTRDLMDTTINLDELKLLLSGNPPASFKGAKVVFDNNSSSTIRFLMQKTGVDTLAENCYALESNTAVLDFISKEKNSIGVIGVNWISDSDDSTNLNFRSSVKVLEVAANDTSEYYKPYQAYIAQKHYPLLRELYMLSKEAYAGIGTGFMAFVASERGQRIVLKFGLVPATMPVRLVEFVEDEDL